MSGMLIQWGSWLIIMSLVMGWLGWSRTRPRPLTEPGRLVQPVSMLILGVVCSAFFFGILILFAIFPNGTMTWWAFASFAGFGLISTSFVLAYYTDKHGVDEHALTYTPLFRWRRKRMDWSDVSFIRYSHVLKWFVLRSRNGDVARLSVMLMGLPEFARLALQHSPPDALDEATADILRASAEGKLPPVWV